MENTTRKFSQKVDPGTVFPTRWLSTNSVHYVKCPKCGAEPGFECTTPKGRKMDGHSERIGEMLRIFPGIVGESRVEKISLAGSSSLLNNV